MAASSELLIRPDATRILITGANGFVGRYLGGHLLQNAFVQGRTIQIVAAVHPHEGAQTTKQMAEEMRAAGFAEGVAEGLLQSVPLDVTDAGQTEAVFSQVQPQQIYHLAGRASGADRDREGIFAVNVEGTRNVLEAASRLSPFPRALVISTGYVYGDTDPARPAREEDPIGPLWRYGHYTDSKIEMETVARGYRAFALIARAFSHTGPGQTPTFAIPTFAQQLARIEKGLEPPLLKVGNLEARRDLLDVRDVVRAYMLLMEKGQAGEAYNVCTGHPVAIREVLEQLRALCTVPTEVTLDPARVRPADIACSTGDPLRTWTITNWTPRYSLETTLRDTLDYWRSHISTETH